MLTPPKRKLIAGFNGEEQIKMENIIARKERSHPITPELKQPPATPPYTANMETPKKADLIIDGKTYSIVLANEESGDLQSVITKLADDKTKAAQDFANERKPLAAMVIASCAKARKIL